MKKENFESCYRVNVTLLKITGLLPFETVPKFVNSLCPFLSIFSLVSTVGPSIYGVIYHWNDIDLKEKTHIITLEGIIFFGFFKAVILVVQRNRISELIYFCKSLWNSIAKDEEYQAMKPFIRQGKYMCYSSIGLCFGVVSVSAIGPVFAEVVYDVNGTVIQSKQLPFPTEMVHQNQLIFNIWWAFQVPLIFLSCINTIAIDHGINAFTLCAAAQMKIVAMRLDDITKLHRHERRDGSRNVDVDRNLEIRKKFYECVSRHRDLLNYCRKLEDLFNPVYLIATIMGMGSVAMDGYGCIMKDGEKMEYVPHLIGLLVQLLSYSWAPQSLMNECTSVCQAIYSLPWTSWSLEDKKSVRFMLMRAQKPATLTAGKFVVMSILLFSEIISRAVSFFTVMRTTL